MAKTPSKQSKATRAAGRTAGGERGEILVVGTKVKDVVKNAGCMSSAELLDELSMRVHEMLLAATQRAKQNGRSTVRPYDL